MTQWIYSQNTGADPFTATVDLEKVGGRFQGRVLIVHSTFLEIAKFETSDLGKTHNIKAIVTAHESFTSRAFSEQEMKDRFPDYQHEVSASFAIHDDKLSVTWKAGTNEQRSLDLPASTPEAPSKVPVMEDITSWAQFSAFCSNQLERSLIYRGQQKTFRLRTAFHRKGRSDLYRYTSEDLPTAYRALSGKTSHTFNSANSDENAAFLNLLQHHGFPTPLLDWSESPFIAAYFAYHPKRHPKDDPDEKVRILCFDHDAWHRDWRSYPYLTGVGPHATVIYPFSFENLRAGPQQALSMVTNVDDIETYIQSSETLAATVYLRAIDLPYSDRENALKDLAMMGITPGSLFPGLDGTCEDLRDRFFGR